ncbi:viperin family antiviral radical SAM protein [Tenacibaculum salmonis]|uniref:viperin family antiviral radical SAM protein n=1 Tax=Tenacibaculum sp. P3-BQ1 TaxID=3232310 RepID=UPI0034DDEB61
MSKLVDNSVIPVVNYHLWKACNYKCKFCFGTFNDVKKNNLKTEEAKQVVQKIVDYGFEKITFSGGEPTLCKDLSELLKIAKKGGMTTSIVTNGSMLNYEWLNKNKKYLDWIAISIDSVDLDTNIKSGRFNKKNGFTRDTYIELINLIKDLGFKLKINTVVSNYNKNENLTDFINQVKPLRWKIFQALPVEIQNDEFKNDFIITQSEFNNFLERHKDSSYIKESNYDMKGSYIMIDPIGRFFDNSKGIHKYSSKINSVGMKSALSELNYCFKKFINREGLYNWK